MVELLITLIVVGLVLYLVETYVPLSPPIKTVIRVLVVLVLATAVTTRQRLLRILAALCLLPAWPFIWAADLCLRLGRARLVDTLVTPADEHILRWLEDKREQRFH